MAFIKRTFFFIVVNLAVMFTIGILIQVLGLQAWLDELGPGYSGLLMICFVWGMAGSFLSLFISKWMAKRAMGVQILAADTRDPQARELVQRVHQLARKAGLSKMPEVGFYDSPEINAFATGPGRNNSLVAVSSGLLQRMNDSEVEGVLGHEVAHIANGDMVTMTLIQGIVNSFVFFFAHLAASALSRGDSEEGGNFFMEFLLRQVLIVAFGILATPIVAGFSRWREYRADLGGARLAGRDKMIGALQALQGTEDRLQQKEAAFSNLMISGKRSSPIARLFMTHPPLEDRIARLSRMRMA